MKAKMFVGAAGALLSAVAAALTLNILAVDLGEVSTFVIAMILLFVALVLNIIGVSGAKKVIGGGLGGLIPLSIIPAFFMIFATVLYKHYPDMAILFKSIVTCLLLAQVLVVAKACKGHAPKGMTVALTVVGIVALVVSFAFGVVYFLEISDLVQLLIYVDALSPLTILLSCATLIVAAIKAKTPVEAKEEVAAEPVEESK